MAWSIVGVGTVTTQTAGALTVNLPAGTASGDLIVLGVAWRSGTAASPTKAASWNTAVEKLNSDITANASTALGCGGVYYIVRGGSAPATNFTFTNMNVLIARCVAYRGNSATPKNADNTGQTMAAGGTAVSLTGLSTTSANELIFSIFSGGQEATVASFDATDPSTASGTADTTTAPTAGTWIKRTEDVTTSGADVSLVIVDGVRATAGATGNLTCTASISARHTICAASFFSSIAEGVGAASGAGGSSVVGEEASASGWTFVGLSTTVTQTTNNPTLTLPASIAQGDLIVACMSWRSSVASAPTWPSGWTKVVDELNADVAIDDTAMCCSSMAYIVRGASDPAVNVTVGNVNQLILESFAYRGNDATPFAADNGGATMGAAGGAVSLAGLTTTTPNELIVALFAGAQETGTVSFASTDPSSPAGSENTTTAPTVGQWIKREHETYTAGADGSLNIFDAVRATAGATGNMVCVASISARHSIIAASFKLAVETEDGVGAAAGTGSSSVVGVQVKEAAANATAAGAARGEGESYDHLIPDGDITLDGWTDQASGTTNIFQSIDELVTNDADFVQSPAVTGTATDFKVRLYKNAVQIVEWTHANISASFTEVEQTLSGAEVAAIGAFEDLFIEFDDNAGAVYRFALADAGYTIGTPVTVTYRYRKLTV